MNTFSLIGMLLFVGLVVSVIVLGGNIEEFGDTRSFLLIVGCGAGLTLISFSFREIKDAISHTLNGPGKREDLLRSAYLWECVVRNCLLSGVIATLIALVTLLQYLDDASQIGPAMSVSLLTLLYGILFCVVFPLPAMFIIKKRIAGED